jgi:hypothetical protein
MMKLFYFFLFLTFSNTLSAQEYFNVTLKESSRQNCPGLHSGAIVEENNFWVFVGGRTNGLHGFTPSSAFGPAYASDSLWVYDPTSDLSYKTDLRVMGDTIADAISSSSMQYWKDSNTLYMFGGYGFSHRDNAYITFPTITAINLTCAIDAAINGHSVAPCIRQYTDSFIRVTGANVIKLDSLYYLVFGHVFDGQYQPNIDTNYFRQTYTNEIRRFTLSDDGALLSLENKNSFYDSLEFHRRDYNLMPQRFTDGSYGATAFSGVFQYNLNLPYQNFIDIKNHNPIINTTFEQKLSAYHSAKIPVYDSINGTMHSVFFGGHALYFYDSIADAIAMDTNVPFINTISRVSRYNDGTSVEYRMKDKLPLLMGTNAEFIPLDSIPFLPYSILNLNQIHHKQCVGFIVGGMVSLLPNISTGNTFSRSYANRKVYEVWVDKDSLNHTDVQLLNEPYKVLLYPNPADDNLYLKIENQKDQAIDVWLTNMNGEILYTNKVNHMNDFLKINVRNYPAGEYVLKTKSGYYGAYQKVIITH